MSLCDGTRNVDGDLEQGQDQKYNKRGTGSSFGLGLLHGLGPGLGPGPGAGQGLSIGEKLKTIALEI